MALAAAAAAAAIVQYLPDSRMPQRRPFAAELNWLTLTERACQVDLSL